jgi:hypothetical protein
MLRYAIVVLALGAAGAAQAETQSERNGLGGLRERIEAEGRRQTWRYDDPPPSRQITNDYGRSFRETEYARQREYELNERLIRLENEAAARRFRGY